MHEIVADISQIKDGAFLELIQIEMRRIAENLLDPNVKADQKRELSFKLEFKPSLDKNGQIEYVGLKGTCTSKLASHQGVGSIVYVANHMGNATLFAGDFEQPSLPMEERVKAVK